MPIPRGPPKRYLIPILILSTILILLFLSTTHHHRALQVPTVLVPQQHTPGRAIAPRLGNETAKAELGRAAWKLLHTTMARFPDHPTAEESSALKSYVYLFQRLYPCGECADHFGEVLRKFPPQVSSRSAAAAWACHVHNQVNERLGKEIFDCANIGDFYDCGCADGDEEKKDAGELEGGKKPEMSEGRKEKIAAKGRHLNEDLPLDERMKRLETAFDT